MEENEIVAERFITRNERIETCVTLDCEGPVTVWDWFEDDRYLGKLIRYDSKNLHADGCVGKHIRPVKETGDESGSHSKVAC